MKGLASARRASCAELAREAAAEGERARARRGSVWTAGRGRSAGRSSEAGAPASRSRQ